jgi:pimeloyl-ACP methyl ester carboxylesterase
MSVNSERSFAAVNGARLYYEVAGSGPALTLIHAGIADSRMWDDQFAVFAERFRVVRYDLRGFGQSEMPAGPYTMRDDLRALLHALGIARTHLIGVSMGGSIALDFTLDFPELVSSLVLVAAGISGSKPSDFLREQWTALEAVMERGDLDAVNELELRLWVDGAGRTPDQVNPSVRERVRVMNAGVLANEARNEQGQLARPLDPPALGRLDEIAAPTLVIVGTLDVPDILENADLLAAPIPGARKVVLPGVAHLPPLEVPAEFNRLVLDFLRGTSSQS